jgi:hypothetical protein
VRISPELKHIGWLVATSRTTREHSDFTGVNRRKAQQPDANDRTFNFLNWANAPQSKQNIS